MPSSAWTDPDSGLELVVHVSPFHQSINAEVVSVVVSRTFPTATQKVALEHDTATGELMVPLEFAGLGTFVHCVPSHSSMRAVSPGLSPLPTATQKSRPTHETPKRKLLMAESGLATTVHVESCHRSIRALSASA